MTGTSLDGLDAALVLVEGHGLGLRPSLVRHVSAAFEPGLGRRLRAYAEGAGLSAAEAARLSLDLAHAHAGPVAEAAGGEPIDLIAAHGQTVCHAPPVSAQILSSAALATAAGAPVVSDLRAADLAAGGQGAPITPLADALLFAEPERAVAVVNLGGFVNVTRLPPGRPIDPGYTAGIGARDVCACNHPLDAAARLGWCEPFDAGGARALAAGESETAQAELDAAVARQSAETAAGRSLGDGDSLIGTVRGLLDAGVPGAVAARAACRAIAAAVVSAVGDAGVVRLAGGGAKNACLIEHLRAGLGGRVEPIETRGVPAAAREAVCIAVLGALCADGVPITLPRVTGCRGPAPLAGVFTPASDAAPGPRPDASPAAATRGASLR